MAWTGTGPTSASSVADDAESKFHDCDGLKGEVFEPKDAPAYSKKRFQVT